MVEVTNALLYEALKVIQSDVIKFMDAQRETRGFLRDIRIQMAEILRNMNAYAALVKYDARRERIERALETAKTAQ